MAIETLQSVLSSGRDAVLEGLPGPGLAYVLSSAVLESPLLIVAATEERAEQVAADLFAFGVEDARIFPGEQHVPFDDVSFDPRTVFAQCGLRHQILSGERPRVIVATVTAIQGRWIPDREFADSTALWIVNEEVSRDVMAAQLVQCGYQRVNFVEDPGTFAVRGSVVDVFPPDRARPVRFDLFGDDIASIKVFDPDSQGTFESLESLSVYPIRELVFDDTRVARAVARLEHIAEEEIEVPTRRLRSMCEEIQQRHYFYGIEGLWPAFYEETVPVTDSLIDAETRVVLDGAEALGDLLRDRWARAEGERARRIERHELALTVGEHLSEPEAVERAWSVRPLVRAVQLADDRVEGPLEVRLESWTALAAEMNARREDAGRGEILDPLVDDLKRRFEQRYEVFIACGSRGSAERLRELLMARKIDLPIYESFPAAGTLGEARRNPRRAIVVAGMSAGLLDPIRKVAIVTDVEIFGAARRQRSARKKPPKEGLTTLRALTDGDLVIHVDHGIGRYLGLKRLILNGVDGDYVHLEYAGDDKLYVPVYRLNLLQQYQGAKGARLDKLGGTRWEKAKQRVKDAVLHLAHGLLALQAKRKALPGFALAEPDDHFRAFEATFPYEETPDQQKAIDDVLADLQKDTPMDRLVCGDVGFGKTEVAIRAAFAAITAGRQVAVLVPTTVLAEQHAETFRERLHGEAVNIEALSRFRTPKDTREILSRVKEGKIDVLIGTHRLLSHDVHFHNLGLLVVDEEQRFGVKHKERIKELRSQVHVLTLSATPIPRTLHMAMVGLRDLSLIQTAPSERVSIKTEVTRFDEGLIAEAVRRELTRGGQVFVVHNRVQSIEAMATLMRRLVPEARVAVAHGQMTGERLEKIMVDFIRREHNVLVCTAIIESGIDIPSANTMIVNRADTFGLAQLYQLRGRIGRSRDRAFAYLLLPRSDRITKDAAQRLSVLKRFSELGSGFQIATHDLDIRGAGDLLGADQSGNIAAVGFELYTELLGEAVEQARGQAQKHEIEPDIQLPITAVIPEDYVEQPMQRLAFYQRMATAESDEAIFDIFGEVEGLYGKAPDELRYLAEVMVIRRRLKALGASHLSAAAVEAEVKIGLTFTPDAPVDRGDLTRRLQAEAHKYRLMPSGRLAVTVPAADALPPIELLRTVRREVGTLRVAKSA